MPDLPPASFVFRFALHVPRLPDEAALDVKKATFLPPRYRTLIPAELDGVKVRELRMGWHPLGIAMGVEIEIGVSSATQALFSVWFDTRCTQNVHRATRFCQLYQATVARDLSVSVRRGEIPRARETSDAAHAGKVRKHVAPHAEKSGVAQLRLVFPAETLPGYDPDQFDRLGFFCSLSNGSNPFCFSGNEELPAHEDPSLWQVLQLREN